MSAPPSQDDSTSGTAPKVIDVDARGQACPMPIALLAKALRPLQGGARVRLLATDPAVVPDLQAWSAATGHLLRQVAPRDGVWIALVEKRRG
ncbi:MAG TPA: sulfurtransferase TusA family protein [Myxococcaceae bacterium]|nr:sulfurtransferase TusA family protein [Myxococcaceae bacterium]